MLPSSMTIGSHACARFFANAKTPAKTNKSKIQTIAAIRPITHDSSPSEEEPDISLTTTSPPLSDTAGGELEIGRAFEFKFKFESESESKFERESEFDIEFEIESNLVVAATIDDVSETADEESSINVVVVVKVVVVVVVLVGANVVVVVKPGKLIRIVGVRGAVGN